MDLVHELPHEREQMGDHCKDTARAHRQFDKKSLEQLDEATLARPPKPIQNNCQGEVLVSENIDSTSAQSGQRRDHRQEIIDASQ